MNMSDQIDWYLEHTEKVALALRGAEPGKVARVAPGSLREYGFVRRYLDGVASVDEMDDEEWAKEVYRPESAADRLDLVGERLEEAGALEMLPDLGEQMSAISTRAHDILVGEGPRIHPEAAPSEAAAVAEPAGILREDADDVLCVARAVDDLGGDVPEDLFESAVETGNRLRRGLDEEARDLFVGESRERKINRLAGIEPYGKYLWEPLTNSGSVSRLLRRARRPE